MAKSAKPDGMSWNEYLFGPDSSDHTPTYQKCLANQASPPKKRIWAQRSAWERDWRKERYESRKAHGICTLCGCNLASRGYFTCSACRLYTNQAKSGYTGQMPHGSPKAVKYQKEHDLYEQLSP